MWQLPFYCQVLKLADSESLEREAQAREWRYQALTAIAQENNYSCLVTGHTKSDLAETLLYNLFRGSGADGLQALSWRRPLTSRIQLIRPLLEVTRSETAQFCKEFSLAIWQDITNDELKYRRNRIRQELLPYIRSHFNPQVEHALAQTAELLRADIEYLEIAARELLQAAMPTLELSDLDSHKVGLNRVILRQAPLALQRRVIRQFLHQILGIAPNFAQIKKVTALITAANRSRSDPFPGGEVAEVEGSWIWFQQPR
jgi:tRNA(Ile)-lysidine synthase